MSYLAFALVIFLILWASSLSRRIGELEHKLRKLTPASPPQPSEPAKQAAAPAFAASPAQAVPKLAASDSPRKSDAELAGGWLTKIGVVALLFGIGFFLKYAIDQGWLGVWARIAIGFVAGGLLVVLGELWRKKYQNYAQALSGGGLAILYFTVAAAFQFYSLFSQPVALLLTILITLLGMFLAYRYDSKALAALAFFGGYHAPIFLSAGINQQVAVFTFVTLFNLGAVLLLFKRFWADLLFISLIGTVLNYGFWSWRFSSQENDFKSLIFLLLNLFITFLISAVIFRKAEEKKMVQEQSAQHLGGFYLLAAIFFGAASVQLYFGHHSLKDYLGLVNLLAALIVFMTYALVDRLEHKTLNYLTSFAASGLLVAACLWQFSGKTLDMYLLAAGLVGIIVGFLVKRADLRSWGLIILFIASLYALSFGYEASHQFLFNAKFGIEALAALSAGIAAFAYQKKFSELGAEERSVGSAMQILAAGLVWFGVSAEIFNSPSGWMSANVANLMLSLWWIAYAVVLAVIGGIRVLSILRKLSLLVFGLAILKVFLYDVQALELGYRIVSFITLGVILLVVSFLVQRNKEKLHRFWSGGQSDNGQTFQIK